jgi:pimeloyl-ACP methyl ester carboxylesterase
MRPGGVIDLPAPNPTEPALVLLPGFGEGRRCFEPLARTLNEATGRRTVFVASPRWGASCKPSPPHLRPLVRLANHATRRLEALDISRATGIFHSMSGITGLMAAQQQPGLFERIVLVCAAGHLPQDRFWRLVGSVGRKSIRCLIDSWRDPDAEVRRANRIGLLEGGLYLGANPWRGLSEARAVARTNTRSLIETVQRQGTEVWVVLAGGDVVYRVDPVQKALSFMRPERIIVVPDRPHDLQLRPMELAKLLVDHKLI